MNYLEAIKKAQDGQKMRLPDALPGHYLYWHEADRKFYVHRGPLQSFSSPTSAEFLREDWEPTHE